MPVDEKVELRKGFKNVYFDRSEIGSVDPAGKLHYRGYSIHDLAERSTFEETSYLLLHGVLPTTTQLCEFDAALRACRVLPAEVHDAIRLTKSAHPMDVLRTAVSAMSSLDVDIMDLSPEATIRRGIRLIAATATIVTTHASIREGKAPPSVRDLMTHIAKASLNASERNASAGGSKPPAVEPTDAEKDEVRPASRSIQNPCSFLVAHKTNKTLNVVHKTNEVH